MIRDQLEAFDRQHSYKTYECKVDLLGLRRKWRAWRTRRREQCEYAWCYECGCEAPEGARSEPYCKEHGMRLMRYKRKPKTRKEKTQC